MRKAHLLWLTVLALVLAAPVAAARAPQATAAEIEAADARLVAANVNPARSSYVERHLPFGVNCGAAADSHEFALVQEDYVTWYDGDLYAPLWVAYGLRGDALTLGPGVYARRIEAFRPDPRLPQAEAVTHQEYTNSGFSRGHMAPNADFIFGLGAMLNTYVMTNMCPQYQGFNGGIWSQLEGRARHWARERGVVYVTTGAIFDADGDGRRDPDAACWRTGRLGRIAVPTHFYKLILAQGPGGWEALAVILPHWQERPATLSAAQAFADGLRRVDQVEQITGVNFFPGMPDDQERKLEAAQPTALWP